MDEATARHQHHVEVFEEDPGKFGWRIVNRDQDTGRAVGAPICSVQLYTSRAAADAAASETLRQVVCGSFDIGSPRATG